MLDYQQHVSKESMYNTPPVFPVYASFFNFTMVEKIRWNCSNRKNQRSKSKLLYNEIDRNPLFKGTATKEDRSNMNVTFLLNDEAHQEKSLDAMEKQQEFLV